MKTYLLISPQPWGKMFLSKHNYAIELAEAGNKVYFLNPPVYKTISTRLHLTVKEEVPRLCLVDYVIPVPVHKLRFKARFIYDFIIRTTLIKQLNKLAEFDELWCFEPNIFSSFKAFNAKKKLLFIVDQHDNDTLKKLALDADGVATISSLIMDYFKFSDKPKLLLNHGLNKTFTLLARARRSNGISSGINQPVKVAYVGNLLQGNRIDYKTVQLIVEQNPDVAFHFYGPYQEKENTLGATTTAGLQKFIQFLKTSAHVTLHGILPQVQLANQMHEMDAFLTCYNYLTDDNKSSNCHKIIEYLSTGRVVVSNRIITYENTTGLLEMPEEYTNENLPALFKQVIQNLAAFNTVDKQKARIDFALENTYQKHIQTITRFIEGQVTAS